MGHTVDIVDAGMQFGDFWAARHIDVHINEGEFFSFLGPSGCGKTTLLRLISGHLEASEGKILINDQNMSGIGPNKRNTAMIFQNLALFPLLTVAENIGFGLEILRMPKKKLHRRVDELLELVDLPGIGKKGVNDLSGGQKQRVAIARALAVDPSVLLLDEPLSALDLKLRKHMRSELQKIQQQTGVTFIYITHDQGEALTMSDRVAVMSKGKIEQLATPDTIYNHPATPFVATFVGETNHFQGKISHTHGEDALLETPMGALHCRNPSTLAVGTQGTVFVRPETIFIDTPQSEKQLPQTTSALNQIEARVQQWTFEGPFINLAVKSCSGETLSIRLNNNGRGVDFQQDSSIQISFSGANSLLFADQPGEELLA